MSKSWDSNILKKLKGLVGKGLSTAEIGKRLGVSKNAVVGKLNRMGWNTGVSESPATDKKKNTKKVAPAPKKATTGKDTTTSSRNNKTDKKTAVRSSGKVAGAKNAKKTPKKGSDVKNIVETPAPKVVGRPIPGKNVSVHQRVVQHALEMANLKPNQCRWPIGDPDSENFHFCGQAVFVGKPYCYEHCKQAYQFTPPKKK